MNKPTRYLLFSQIGLYGFLLICTVLMPGFLFSRNQGGVSNYGIHALTVVPYSLGFGLCGVFIFLAAKNLPSRTKSYQTVKNLLLVVAAMCIFAVVTTYTYKLSPSFKHIHEISALALFFVQFFIGIWFSLQLYKDRVNLMLLAAELLGVALGILTLLDVIHVLFVAEVGTGMAFGALMVRTIKKISAY